jgi:hypothetical protein
MARSSPGAAEPSSPGGETEIEREEGRAGGRTEKAADGTAGAGGGRIRGGGILPKKYASSLPPDRFPHACVRAFRRISGVLRGCG